MEQDQISRDRHSTLIMLIMLEIVSHSIPRVLQQNADRILICLGRNKNAQTVHFEDMDPI